MYVKKRQTTPIILEAGGGGRRKSTSKIHGTASGSGKCCKGSQTGRGRGKGHGLLSLGGPSETGGRWGGQRAGAGPFQAQGTAG